MRTVLVPIHIAGRSGRLLLGVALPLLLLLVLPVATATPAWADEAVEPKDGRFTLSGRGWGHGWGMSQYGAYGAALEGRAWQEILAFYYVGTQRSSLAPDDRIRVRISADTDGDLRVRPTRGLTLHSGSKSLVLPTGARYRQWRVTRAGSGYQLSWLDADGRWHTRTTRLGASTWYFRATAPVISLVLPGGRERAYRGRLLLVRTGKTARTVNSLRLENYLRSVVPAEMPTSWHAEAVRAQAVAARTFAARLRSWNQSVGWDVCDTDACQVYRGRASETRRGDDAVRATAGVILRYRGTIAYTQFASSNGGHTARGDFVYLARRKDPYDGVVGSHAWTRTISAAALHRAWPSVGTVQKLRISERDGGGRWGGRVTRVQIIGSKKSVTVSGATFQWRFSLRSRLFTVRR